MLSTPLPKSSIWLLSTAIAVPITILSQAVWASPDPSPVISEILVTAERRTTALHQTPVSVSALQASQVGDQHLQILRDIEGKIPGIATPGSISNMQSVFLRGIGTTDPGTFPAVGIYIDDVYLPRIFGNSIFDLPDLERIEVLRGPQASLYGQNTTAGVIKFISRKPGDETILRIDAGIGNLDTFEAHAYASGPIAEGRLAASVAVSHRERGGDIFNPVLDRDVNRINTNQFRAKLRFTPSDALEIVLSADGARDKSDNATFVPVNLVGSDKNTNYAYTTTTPGGNPELGREAAGLNLNISWTVNDHWTVKSVTAGRYLKDDPSPWDYDSTPDPINDFTQYIDQDFIYQEFQGIAEYDRLSIVTGVTYFDEKFRFSRLTGADFVYSIIDSNLSHKTAAIFAQGTYNLTDVLALTLGARGIKEWQQYENTRYSSNSDGERLAQFYSVSGLKENWSGVTPKISLSYQPTPDVLAYISYTSGQRTGGYNRSASTAQIAALPTDPEKVHSYEAGTKLRALEGRLQISAAAYYTKIKDYIAAVRNPTVDGVVITGNLFVNAASATVYGAEAEVNFVPTDNLEFYWNGQYVHSRFNDFVNPTGAAATDFTGNRLPFASKFIIGSGFAYTLPVAVAGSFKVRGDVKYLSSFFGDIGNTDPFKIDEQFYANAYLDYQSEDHPWGISLRVSNIFDSRPKIRTDGYVPARNEHAVSYALPRQYFVRVSYSY